MRVASIHAAVFDKNQAIAEVADIGFKFHEENALGHLPYSNR